MLEERLFMMSLASALNECTLSGRTLVTVMREPVVATAVFLLAVAK
jgi:hypothetical protein